jgi:nucleotide-binding universal stress UspA family protein
MRIVVGVDGSDGSAQAVRWAADEAAIRGGELVALMSWGYVDQIRLDQLAVEPTYTEEDARVSLAEFVADSLGDECEVVVQQRIVRDLTVPALLDATDGADLLVVGSRGLGGFRGTLLGSVTQECLHHSTIPVAVVRGQGHLGNEHGRVVVGVDGSAASQRGLDWAIEEAVARRAELEVVHSWHLSWSGGYPYLGDLDPSPAKDAATAVVDRALAAADLAALRTPPIRSIRLGDARDALLDASKEADLLVVGAKGVGGFRGMLVGSVSHALAQHAECATVVVPQVSDPR